jgi:hypothetical protein
LTETVSVEGAAPLVSTGLFGAEADVFESIKVSERRGPNAQGLGPTCPSQSDTPPQSGWLDERQTAPGRNVSGGRNLSTALPLFPTVCAKVPGELGHLKVI